MKNGRNKILDVFENVSNKMLKLSGFYRFMYDTRLIFVYSGRIPKEGDIPIHSKYYNDETLFTDVKIVALCYFDADKKHFICDINDPDPDHKKGKKRMDRKIALIPKKRTREEEIRLFNKKLEESFRDSDSD